MTTHDQSDTALPLTNRIYDALPRGEDGERLQAAILEYGALCASNALKTATRSVPAAPDMERLAETIAAFRQLHSAATAAVSEEDPEERRAQDKDLVNKQVPFTMYEVDWDELVVKPVTITRFGINTAVGATAPSIDVRYADGRKASASTNMFYLREEWAQAEVDQARAERSRDAAKKSFIQLAFKEIPHLLSAAEAFVYQSAVDYKSGGPELVFEVTGAGFDGATDETDDRVLWVTAPSIEAVQAAIDGLGATVVQLKLTPGPGEVDFHLPENAADLWKRCHDFSVGDEHERVRRTRDIPNLRHSAGAFYTFYQIATKAIADAFTSGVGVDWHQVESDTIRVSLVQNGQKPADVTAALLRYSPGAVGAGRESSIAERVVAAEESLLQQGAPGRDLSAPAL